jgi:hypothetical protein
VTLDFLDGKPGGNSNDRRLSSSELEVRFHGKAYAVPKKFVVDLLDQRNLLAASSYAVESSVPVEVLEAFVASLQTQRKVSVMKENAGYPLFLAMEFFLSELLSECSFDLLMNLRERVSVLERQTQPSSPDEVRGGLETQEEGLESLSSRFEKLEGKLSKREVLIGGKESGRVTSLLCLRDSIERLVGQASEPSSGIAKSESPPPTPERSLSKAEFPMKAPQSLEGIISYLTKKHGGNVHEKGIVTITSKSVVNDNGRYPLKNVADLTSDSGFNSVSDSCFISKNEPGQWICWDFREMRVRPTHYTIKAIYLKSWVVEGSLDGESWAEIDQQTNNQDFVCCFEAGGMPFHPVDSDRQESRRLRSSVLLRRRVPRDTFRVNPVSTLWSLQFYKTRTSLQVDPYVPSILQDPWVTTRNAKGNSLWVASVEISMSSPSPSPSTYFRWALAWTFQARLLSSRSETHHTSVGRKGS